MCLIKNKTTNTIKKILKNKLHCLIFVGAADSDARVWSMDGETLHLLEGHKGPFVCMTMSETQILFTGSLDHNIRSWDINNGSLLRAFAEEHTGAVMCMTVSTD